jgi:hypothetical protein
MIFKNQRFTKIMKSNCKFLYALAAFVSVKLFFLSIMFGINGELFGYGSFINSNPLQYLFQIMFILFFISPPLIVILLFLIWKELKNRNKMK